MFDRLRTRLDAGRQDGFTLIELLIVIVILGVLAGIVVFAVGNASSDSKLSACQADKKTLSTALEAYKAKVGTYPASAQSATSNSLLVPDYLKSWPGAASGTGTAFATAASTGAITVSGAPTC